MVAYIERICRLCDHYGYRRVGAPLGFCKRNQTETEREKEGCGEWERKAQEWRNG
jgi:hypothetical protein